jgi:hypothetical protein
MIVRDNSGNICGEQNVTFTAQGTVLISNTLLSTGRVVAQQVSITESNGIVRTANLLGGKLLP